MKKIAAIVLSLVMVFAFASCGGGGSKDSGDKVVIHMGSSVATTHAWYRAAEEFKANVEEQSGGSMEVVLDFGGVHGTDKEMCEAISAGTLEMGIGSTVGIDAVVTELGFVNLPYLMTSFDEVEELMYNGWMGEKAAELMAKHDMTVLDWTDCDFRWMSNSKTPIKSVSDLKGMKMRTPEAPMYLKFFEELGTTPTSIPFTDLPSALQQKTVDGQDNGPILSYTSGLYQFQKYWTKTNHAYAAAAVYMNTGFLEGLTDDQQKIIKDCAVTYGEKVQELARTDLEDYTQKMEDEGCQIIDPTPELEKAMRSAAEKVWQDESCTSTFDQDAVDRILKDAGLK